MHFIPATKFVSLSDERNLTQAMTRYAILALVLDIDKLYAICEFCTAGIYR